MKVWILLGALLGMVTAQASPLQQAQQRAKQTFEQSRPLPVTDTALAVPWQTVPFDPAPFTYTFAELQAQWPQLMRALQFSYPSPDYLARLYQRFPSLFRDLHYQDDDWQQHSANVLEIWQAFFRGDLRYARDQGRHYGGYARFPAVLAQLVYASYLEPSHSLKQQLLQDAVNEMVVLAEQMPVLPGDEDFADIYVLLRLGFSYGVGRIAEDEPVATVLNNGYGPQVINAATELLAVQPDHPLGLAMAAGFEANVVRRVGKAAGRLTFAADSGGANAAFQRALALLDDSAIVRYEYANTLLYTDQDDARQQALRELQVAAQVPVHFSMEWLDRAYARKRLDEVQAWRDSGRSFRRFDRQRRRHMRRDDANLYAVTRPPFLID